YLCLSLRGGASVVPGALKCNRLAQARSACQKGIRMKAIIVAAGMGSRLAPYTDDRPKCLVEVNGRSILQRQLDAYRACGVQELVIIPGYRNAEIPGPG